MVTSGEWLNLEYTVGLLTRLRTFEFFAASSGAEPKIEVRFDHEDWYFLSPDAFYETSDGNYRVKMETAIADGTDFDELTGHSGRPVWPISPATNLLGATAIGND